MRSLTTLVGSVLLALHSAATRAETVLFLSNLPGDYVGHQRQLFLSSADGAFTGAAEGATLYLDFVGREHQTSIVLTGPGATTFPGTITLVPGTYVIDGSNGPGHAYVSVAVDGLGCGTDQKGRLVVSEITATPEPSSAARSRSHLRPPSALR